MSDTLALSLLRHGRSNWNTTAIHDSSGRTLTYGELLSAAMLLGRRIPAAARCVGILLPASAGGAIANLAVALAGRVPVNVNFTAGLAHLQFVVSHCELSLIFTSRQFLAKIGLPELPEMVMLEDLLTKATVWEKLWAYGRAKLAPLRSFEIEEPLATILYSSGSTGTPKGVMLTHENLRENMRAVGSLYPVTRRDVMLAALPFFHSFGFVYTLWFPLLYGFPVVYHANPTDAKVIGELAQRFGATFLLSTPTFVQSYVRRVEPAQFRTLQYVLVGAEKLSPMLQERFAERFGVALQEGYGCTEMSPVVAVNAFDVPGQARHREGSVGRPLPGTVVRIVHPETGTPLPVGATGLLLTGGPSRMVGYWKDPARTEQSLRDGLYVTGDLARLDEDGFLFLEGRLARFSKIGGEMISHGLVEEVARRTMQEHGFQDPRLVVVGLPDATKGERLMLLYVDESDCTPEAAKACAQALWRRLQESSLPALAIPKVQDIVRIPALPTLGSGKLDLQRARQIAQEVQVA